MKTKSRCCSGFFTPRALVGFALCSTGAWLALLSFASTPSSGTLTNTSGPISYTAGPFFVANPTPVIEVDSGPECSGSTQPCDDFKLTVSLPSGYTTTYPNASVKVTLSWTDSGSGSSDYDLYIYKAPRGDCSPNDCTSTDGSQAADYQSASTNNPEIATISPLHDGSQTYTIVVVPYTPTGETVHVKAELVPGSGSTGGVPGFGGPDPTAPGVPRYQNFYAPDGTSAQSSEGEFNIGYNPKTGRIMNMNLGPVWRITPPELLSPAKPECCEGLWEDKSNPATNTGLDPILWTDQKTGRTFVSNSTAGANAVYGYSDNDGDTWVPLAASPPSGGTDHETIGSGPYPASLSTLSSAANQGEAVYYCSQSWPLGPATCQRSDTLGASYGPGVFAYYGNGITKCEGLHGHVHVAPDGTVWLPVNQCAGNQGGAFSTDGVVTWHEFIVPNAISQDDGAQHAIGIWQQGGSHQDPNLLDFNEITVDKNRRVLYGYSDGCVSDGCIAGTAPNDFTAFMRVARQSGGKTLFASYDTNTDTTTAFLPKPPCLSGARDSTESFLSWKAPDNGGAAITGYEILRGTSSGGETVLVANTGSDKTTYIDTTVDPTVADYYYTVKAINSVGIGNASNEIDLKVGPSLQPPLPYSCSGNDVVTDPAGDAHNPSGLGGTTSQADITAISFSANTPAPPITTKMNLPNLTDVPSAS